MTRMIERWFPCTEVSENSAAGWGSGNTERALFTWFAARPTAQAKAAVICSLLPWPDTVPEQKRLQELVKTAMTGRYAAWDELRIEINKAHPDGASVLDPFAGRGMIPLEAARLGIPSFGVDYSAMAVLGGHLLTDFPFRDWSDEPELPFGEPPGRETLWGTKPIGSRLVRDVEALFDEIARRHFDSMASYYPEVAGRQPWGHLWAATIPCQECSTWFPLVGSLELIRARRTLEPQSFRIHVNADGSFDAVVHAGVPSQAPTLTNAILADGRRAKGKSATCPFCGHVHPLEVHRRLVNEGQVRDSLLLTADIDDRGRKQFRPPTGEESLAADSAGQQLRQEPPFTRVLPAIPAEGIRPGNNNIIGPSIYGARTYGDFMVDRQTLSYVRLARIIGGLGDECQAAGLSTIYARALVGYATAVVVKKLRRSTRGARFQAAGGAQVGDLFVNEGSITFSHDFFEAGIGTGPGTWDSISRNVLSVVRGLVPERPGTPTEITRGTATKLDLPTATYSAVVTDPPYDAMIAYSDASDLFYCWIKRCTMRHYPELGVTGDPFEAQDKALEIIVKRQEGTGKLDVKDHRDRAHYDRLIQGAFKEMRRVVRADGVVTIVFGHGNPEVWQRLLNALTTANLVMTGSWPARTEAGGSHGNAHIETTLSMACRPAQSNRPAGRKAQVEAEVQAEVAARIDLWETSDLAPTDMLMASAGPAMEVVGRYSRVLDIAGEPVDPAHFLVVARRAVRENARVEIDHHPLDTFDARTRFALWWVKLFGKTETAKSELRWQTLADDLDLASVRDLVPDAKKGVIFTDAKRSTREITPESAVIDVALRMAKAWPEGMETVGQVLAAADKDTDPYLWASVTFLADRLPNSDPDAIAWTKIVRNRNAVTAAARGAQVAAEKQADAELQGVLDFSERGKQ